MSEIRLTEKQQSAVMSRGGAILVSAAAGSGKTKVLTERLLKMVDEEGKDIDSFLIITYTNAAAAEMRGKIIEALIKLIAQKPGQVRLRRQLERCYRAKISTIHSFCVDIIRQNAHLIDITPDFKVIDEIQADIIKEKVLGDVLEEKYAAISENNAFSHLTDMVSTGRSDKKLAELVLEVYKKMRMSPAPEQWAHTQKDMLSLEGISDAGETVWGKMLISEARSCLDYWYGKMEDILTEAENDGNLWRKYGKSLIITVSGIKEFRESLDLSWDEIRQHSKVEFPRPGGISGYEDIKKVRNSCKDDLAKLAKIFESMSSELLGDLETVKPAMNELLDIALEFGREYEKEKKRRGVIDFSDQEHFALRILADENGNPTDTAKAVSENYTEIMVDEYQDVNAVQEAIFSAVSKSGKNIFMVGDVKQSIYRFRLADPGIFIQKYRTLKSEEEAADGEGRKIILSTNFRSRSGVLMAVNHIFKNIMSRQLGEIDYTQEEYLYPGLEFPENDQPQMELCIVDTGAGGEDEDENIDKTELEADEVAKKIAWEHANGKISDGAGGLKAPDWRDFTILLRSVKDKAAVYGSSLQKLGIPVAVDKSEDFFQSAEILTMMSFLAVIDNPRQDIPLISVLRSFLFGFTPDDLAFIRSRDKNISFYDALNLAATENERAGQFLSVLNMLRKSASEKTADALLWEIYLKTNALAIAGAMPEGETRQENLMALLTIAQKYESDGYKGLFGFNTYLRETAANGGAVIKTSSAGDDNAVKIMSIHKSKGLEYPIVILADAAKRFNKGDAQVQLPIHQQLGLGPEIIDLKRKIKYPSIARMAVSKQIIKETLSEEMRVLYVALTRAKEKIIVFSSFKNADRCIEKLSVGLESPISPKILEGASSFADWIIMTALLRKECAEILEKEPAVCSDDGCKWALEMIKAEPINVSESVPHDTQRKEEVNEDQVKKLWEEISFSYPNKAAVTVPSKLTATELKGKFTSAEADEQAQGAVIKQTILRRPDFKKNQGSLTGAEKGTALHLVMQFINYDKCSSIEEIKDEIQRLVGLKIITEKQAAAVDAEKILRLFRSELGDKIRNASEIKREFKFSLLIPAEKFYPAGRDDEILLQGVIDCLLIEEDGLTVIDYKTDAVTEKTVYKRAELYKGQVKAYETAMEKIMGKKVKNTGLYFFALDKTLWL